jgi:hypothetical protein
MFLLAVGTVMGSAARRNIQHSGHSTRPDTVRGGWKKRDEGVAVDRPYTVCFHHGHLMCP